MIQRPSHLSILDHIPGGRTKACVLPHDISAWQLQDPLQDPALPIDKSPFTHTAPHDLSIIPSHRNALQTDIPSTCIDCPRIARLCHHLHTVSIFRLCFSDRHCQLTLPIDTVFIKTWARLCHQVHTPSIFRHCGETETTKRHSHETLL